MQERELIKLMLEEWPHESFNVEKETWCHIPHDKRKPEPTFKISLIDNKLPGNCIIFYSSKNWQNVYDKFKLWKEDQK